MAQPALRAGRRRHQRRGREVRQDHRGTGHHGSRVPRGGCGRRVRADPARAVRKRTQPRSRCSCSTRPAGRRWSTSRCSSGCRRDTPIYGLERVEGSIEERAAEYVPKLMEIRRQGPLHPGRLVAGRGTGLRLRGRAQAQRVRRPLRRADRHRACRRGGAADQGGDPRPLGSLRAVRRSAPSTSRSPRSLTSSSNNSTTRARSGSCWTPSRRPGSTSRAASSSTSARPTWTTGLWTPPTSSRTTATSRCTWPIATTTTRSCSSRATPSASPTAAGASSSPTWRSCRSGASTSRRSTSRTSPRWAPT